MITLASFRPEFFDNNGDQSNLSVLTAHLEALGAEVEIAPEIPGADFVLIGDSSIAAHAHFESELLALLPELKLRLSTGRPTLLVGRSWEFFAPLLGFSMIHGERSSKFVKLIVSSQEVIGYHNSTVLEPRFSATGAFIGTTLFGPLLAKNPGVLKMIVNALGLELTGEYFQESERLANLVRESTTF